MQVPESEKNLAYLRSVESGRIVRNEEKILRNDLC